MTSLGNLKQLARFIKPGLNIQIYGNNDCGVEWISELNQYLLNEMGVEFKTKKLVDGVLIYTEDEDATGLGSSS